MEEKKSSFRWVVLVLLFLCIFATCLSMNTISPLFKEIQQEIPLTKTDMGTIIGVTLIASILLSLIGGAISDRIGSKWVFGAALIVIAIFGALRSIAGGLYSLLVFTCLMGGGTALVLPNISKAVGMWFSSKELGLANGICMFGMSMSTAAGMALAAGVLSPTFGGWRNVMVALGVFTLVIGIIWLLVFKEKKMDRPGTAKKQNVMDNFKRVFKVKDMWYLALYTVCNGIAMYSLVALLPSSFCDRGMSAAKAGSLVGIMLFASAFCKPVGGALSDWLAKRKPFLSITTIVFGLFVFTFPFLTGIPLIVSLVIAGLALGSISPILMLVPVENEEIGPSLAATAYGLIVMGGNLGGLIGPIITGKLMDITGVHWPGLIFIGAVLIIAAFFIIPVRETGQGRKKKE